jgi:hypothetical protein
MMLNRVIAYHKTTNKRYVKIKKILRMKKRSLRNSHRDPARKETSMAPQEYSLFWQSLLTDLRLSNPPAESNRWQG